jgi:restriction system protein
MSVEMTSDNNLSVSRVNPSASTAITIAAWNNNSWEVAADMVALRHSRLLGAAALASSETPLGVSVSYTEGPDLPTDVLEATQLLLQAVVVTGEKTPEGQIIEAVTIPWFDIIAAVAKDPNIAYQIDPRKWEEIIAGAYERYGFDEVILTPRSGDLGRDVIATKKALGQVRIIDQVKAFKPQNLVTANDVRALMGVLQTDGASKGFLTTTSDFAPKLRTDALITPLIPQRLELVDGKMLIERLRDLANR